MAEEIHRTTFNLRKRVIKGAKRVRAKGETLTDLVHEGLNIIIRRRSKRLP